MRSRILTTLTAVSVAALGITGCAVHKYKVAYAPAAPAPVVYQSAPAPTSVTVQTPPATITTPAPAASETTTEIVAPSEPPALPTEVIPASPGANFVWTPGYWTWSANSWVWVHGSWAARPYPSATWVPPHFVKHHHEYVWVSGYWR